MSFFLRPANAADLPAVVKLMNIAFRGKGPNASWNVEAAFVEGDRTSEALLREELAEKPDSTLLIAEADAGGAMLGCVVLEPMATGAWHLGSLTVDPLLQKGGLGRSLLEAAEAWAVERGARTIRMHVVNVRDTLIAWYERRGYRLTGESEPFPYQDHRFGTPMRDDLKFVILEKGFPEAAKNDSSS